MACYLIHIEPPYKHAGHYIGFADDVGKRFEEHSAGRGSRLLQVAVEAGCTLRLARTWPDGDRTFERRLHNRNGGGKMCPICKEKRTGKWQDDVNFWRN